MGFSFSCYSREVESGFLLYDHTVFGCSDNQSVVYVSTDTVDVFTLELLCQFIVDGLASSEVICQESFCVSDGNDVFSYDKDLSETALL